MTMHDLFSYVYSRYKESTGKEFDLTSIDDQQESLENLLHEFNAFPGSHFIDLNGLIMLSSMMYEQQPCHGRIVFVPHTFEGELSIKYENTAYQFSSNRDHIEMIRKLLQPLDSKHAIVFYLKDNCYVAVGVARWGEFTSKATYIINIRRHMSWEISYLGKPLFQYKDGIFMKCERPDYISYEIIRKIKSDKYGFPNIDTQALCKAIKKFADNTHGTSFVVFENDNDARDEAIRLSGKNRGVYVYKELSVLKKDIVQTVNVDGGLIFSASGNFYGFSYIFDGTIPEIEQDDIVYDGTSYKGSRHNSLGLYIYCKNSEGIKCIGVVISSDNGYTYYSKNSFQK